MAGKLPLIVVRSAKVATANWLVKAGKIERPSQLKLNKTFIDYGLSESQFHKLAGTIVMHVKRSTGHSLSIEADWLKPYYSGSVSRLLGALPGRPHTTPTRPTGKPESGKA
jgi:hypothetical protein